MLDAHSDFIIERINAIPHLTLYGLKDELAVRGVKVSHHAVWLFLRPGGLRFKKPCTPWSRPAPTSPGGGAGARAAPDRSTAAGLHR